MRHYWDNQNPHLIYLLEVRILCISDFSNCELLAIANTLSVAISNQTSKEDLLVLSAFFSVLGDNLALLAL